MTGFGSNRAYAEAFANGQTAQGFFRKVPGLASVAGWWSDLGMAAGNPPPNYYASAPLIAARLDKWDGICHGDQKTPASLYLANWMMTANSANCVGPYTLCDYALYYPFVDLDSTDEQAMNNATALNRYVSGAGLQPMMVAQAPTTGAGTFSFVYINQDGVSKTAPVQKFSGAAGMGSLLTTQPGNAGGGGRFLNLDQGDTGVRSITSFTCATPNGGLGCIVLVKPLADLMIFEINTPSEVSYLDRRPGLPQIEDGAFLGIICSTAGSIAATNLTGRLDYVWN